MKCCNHIFSTKDIKPPLGNINDKNLYSGNAKKSSIAECPECGKKYTLFLKPIHQSYKVIGIQEIKSNEIVEEQETTDFYCQEHDKYFKSNQGLKVHIRQKHKSK